METEESQFARNLRLIKERRDAKLKDLEENPFSAIDQEQLIYRPINTIS